MAEEKNDSPVGKTGLKYFEPEFLALWAIKYNVSKKAKEQTKAGSVSALVVILDRVDDALETAALRLQHLDANAQNADLVAAKAVEKLVGDDPKTLEFPAKG